MLYSTMLKLMIFFFVASFLTVSSKGSIDRNKDESSSSEEQTPLAAIDRIDDSNKDSSGSSTVSQDDSSSSADISEEKIPPTSYLKSIRMRCKINETYSSCLDPCPRDHCDFNVTFARCKSPPKVGDKECVPGCRCANNHYRNKEGNCVLKSDCPKCFGKDEIYEECPFTCPAQICENIWTPHFCPRVPLICRPSCRCKPNMYRNFKRECISKEDCMKCRGPNEYFSCGVACDNECARMSKQNQTYCPILTKQCTKRCYCKPGYARDIDGHCIPISTCPAECKDNEEYIKNTKAINRPRTCSEFLLGLMPFQKDDEAAPGCVCVPGYVRNHKDICVPQKECYTDVVHGDLLDANLTEVIAVTTLTILLPPPPECGPNEVMSNCKNNGCQKQECSQLGKVDTCVYIPPTLCKRGCQCKEGYLRDMSGKCIPIADCPNRACDRVNEIYEECPNTCITEACDPFPSKIYCPPPKICKPSCRCKPNTCRNNKDVCVPKLVCKENEQYIRNINMQRRPKTCKDAFLASDNMKNNSSIDRYAFYELNPGCVCIPGYVRNEENICIPIKDCPPPCGMNEVYVNDTSKICRPMDCSEIGYKLNCFESERFPGQPGCVCRDGFVKDIRGNCISKTRCSSCGGDSNATGGCGVFCETCDTYKNGPKMCPKICFPNACQCKSGYIYDSGISKCVLPEACGDVPSPTPTPDIPFCGPNETQDGCTNGGCGRRNCSQLIDPQMCIDVIPSSCIKGCRCKDNYLRDYNGICIPITECPVPDCGPNKVFDFCPANCLPDCDVDETLILCEESPKLGDPKCNPSCRCADNLYKTKDGGCVPKEQCEPPSPACSENEVEDGCTNGGCGRRTCSELDKPIKCVKIPGDKCIKGCRCKENYLRDENGVCIPITQCPKPDCGEGKVFDFCPAYCLPDCNVDPRLIRCKKSPSLGDPECSPSCRCADNLYRTSDGGCVPKEQCDNSTVVTIRPPTCGKNQVFDECPDPCPRGRCDVDERLIRCKSPPEVGDPECKPGCRCADKYYRTKDGECVLKSQCPKCTGKYEVYNKCPPTCPPQKCESLWSEYHCMKQKKPTKCIPSCTCKPNYYRNLIGECTAKEDCLKCQRPFEYFSCGGACDNECDKISRQNQTSCPIVNITCNKKCYCKPGYARNVDNDCIPISQCPPECKENEKYVKNTNEICKAETCSDLGEVLDCFQEGYDNSGEPGCVCVDGYIRNEDGVCIPIEQCPSCGGDFNATSGSGTFCTTCSNYDQQDQIACILLYKLNGCACRENYVYDESIKKCVLPSDCPNRMRKPNPTNHAWRDDFDYGNEIFTSQFLNTVIEAQKGSSIITSPFSVLFLLAQLALFAKGTTYEQLANILNIKNNTQIRNIVPNYLNDINSQNNVTIQLAEKVYGNYKYPFSKSFKRATRLNFYAEAENLDFSDARAAAATINSWIASQTNNLIQDLVPSSALTPNTRLVLTNAIYFKGDWKQPFKSKNTKLKDFYVDESTTVSIKMMYQESHFNFGNLDSINAKVIQMFYKSNNFSFVAILPNEDQDITSLAANFYNTNVSLKNDVIGKLKWAKVRVTIPLIETETSTNLMDVLMKNGVTDIFDPAAAELTGILEEYQQLYVSAALQKAKIIVNEAGSEAAAGNAMIVGATAVRFEEEPEEFNANKPFMYYIMFKNTPIFAGIFMGDK